jgi:parvulin-like peptidyl-prolyl isomerase
MQDTSFITDADRSSFAETQWGILQEALKNRSLARYIQADDASIKAVYDRMGTQLKVATIRVPTLVELDSVQAALARGVRFADAARKYSKEPATAARGGELGWIVASKFPIPVQEQLWAAETGAVVGPIADRQFHTLFKILDRRPGPPLRSFEQEKPDIVRFVHIQETGKAGAQFHDDLMARYHYRVDPEAAEWIRAFLRKETASARRQYDPKVDKPYAQIGEQKDGPFWTEAPLKGDDALRPIAFIDGDTLPAIEVIDELIFRPTLIWPRFESVDDILELCDSALYPRVMVREAKRVGLDREPDVLEQYWDRRRRFLWRIWRNVYLVPQITPSETELRSLYEAQPERWNVPERRRFVLVSASTRAIADEVAAMLREGEVPSNIVRALEGPSVNFEVTPDTTDGWYTRGRLQPPLETALFNLPEGTVSDVMSERGRYTVMRVEKVSPAQVLSFGNAATGLRSRIIAEREKKATADLISQAARKFPVTIHRDVIERIDIDLAPFTARGSQRRGP